MTMIGFPLLLIPLAIVNIFVFLMPGVAFTDPIVTFTLTSRAVWKLTFGDALLTLGVLLLLCEVVKGSRPAGKYFTDHFLSLLVLAAAIAEFLLLPQFANSVQFLLIVLMLVDFLAGLTLRWRRRGAVAAKSSASKSAASKPSHAVWEPAATVPAAPEPRPELTTPPPLATIEPAHPATVSDGDALPAIAPVSGEAGSDISTPGSQAGSPSSLDHPPR